MDINGKVAIVTGGASGLGEATVRRYLGLGAKVAIFDMNEARGNALVNELGADVIYRQVNVADEDQVAEAVAATVEAFGAVHICNNFAGIGDAAKTVSRGEPVELARFKKVIDVNLIGTFNVLRLAAAQMAKQDPINEDGARGVIINTASVAAFEGQVGQAAYSASKGGIVGMTLPIARDLASLGIRVNTIAPGLIHTPLFESLPTEAYDSLAAQPVYPKRLGKPDEISHLSQYIVENDYTNGETIRMDGAIRMQPR
ncbi:SDR family NAD(P)-dependent oxidoreductase [Congregibacter brevis]|uniref:SDR family NAD(P)-dependent oxidoreductase n=1 Tax=Congregibacter brevis TaxID=3081201 RepID=A0ABZ0I9W0_9GAMM|nr:SDR family NAD(P)-dependent oxidoreductase [Congregibacter sp. IMCC45268]